MNYKERIYSARLARLAAHFPVVVVSGARQVGKSTLITHGFPDWDCVVFDPVVDIGNARADPELFLDNHPPPVVLDEIQYCPELVPVIKRRVDQDRRAGQYVLTGSQQWAVLRSIGESLAGRAVFLDMEGFSLAELTESIPDQAWLERYLEHPDTFVANPPPRLNPSRTLYELLWRGGLPDADRLPGDLIPDFFAAYVRTYVERDVRLLLDADDWQQFGRFVQLVAALTAQEINYSQLGREIAVTPQTARRWLAVLKATFQWHELPAWQGNAIKRVSTRPKGHFADSGLACHLLRLSAPDAIGGHPLAGALFESAVAAEIRKQMAPLARKAQIYHWRSHGGAEVDMLLERDNVLYPIEVKLGSRLTRRDTRGLAALRETYPHANIAPGLMLAPVHEPERITRHDYAIPWDTR